MCLVCYILKDMQNIFEDMKNIFEDMENIFEVKMKKKKNTFLKV